MMKSDIVFEDLLQEVERLLKKDSSGRDRSDVVAELLGILAGRMTELYAAREGEVAAFHGWLEERLGCAIDDLAGKTVMQEYYEQRDVDVLLTLIARNHPGRTSLDVRAPRGYGARNPNRDLITDGYERSMSVLRPIMRQIQLTDRLIDVIVYRLYGLTSRDISLVDHETGYMAAEQA